jgi:molybdopterin converting factor small subunit
MKIRFYAPFNTLTGDIVELSVHKEMTLPEFYRLLADCFPGLLDFLPYGNENIDLFEKILFVANKAMSGKILSASDVIRDEDFIEIMPPITGG